MVPKDTIYTQLISASDKKITLSVAIENLLYYLNKLNIVNKKINQKSYADYQQPNLIMQQGRFISKIQSLIFIIMNKLLPKNKKYFFKEKSSQAKLLLLLDHNLTVEQIIVPCLEEGWLSPSIIIDRRMLIFYLIDIKVEKGIRISIEVFQHVNPDKISTAIISPTDGLLPSSAPINKALTELTGLQEPEQADPFLYCAVKQTELIMLFRGKWFARPNAIVDSIKALINSWLLELPKTIDEKGGYQIVIIENNNPICDKYKWIFETIIEYTTPNDIKIEKEVAQKTLEQLLLALIIAGCYYDIRGAGLGYMINRLLLMGARWENIHPSIYNLIYHIGLKHHKIRPNLMGLFQTIMQHSELLNSDEHISEESWQKIQTGYNITLWEKSGDIDSFHFLRVLCLIDNEIETHKTRTSHAKTKLNLSVSTHLKPRSHKRVFYPPRRVTRNKLPVDQVDPNLPRQELNPSIGIIKKPPSKKS